MVFCCIYAGDIIHQGIYALLTLRTESNRVPLLRPMRDTFPSVFWAASDKRSNPDWDSFIVYFAWVVGEGYI